MANEESEKLLENFAINSNERETPCRLCAQHSRQRAFSTSNILFLLASLCWLLGAVIMGAIQFYPKSHGYTIWNVPSLYCEWCLPKVITILTMASKPQHKSESASMKLFSLRFTNPTRVLLRKYPQTRSTRHGKLYQVSRTQEEHPRSTSLTRYDQEM